MDSNQHFSFFYKHASSTINFTPPDSKKLFEKHLNKYPDNKDLLHYKNNPIEYTLNDYGFRTSDNIDDAEEEGNVFLGCSHTFGLGHYLKNTWSWKLNQKIGGKFWNLSTPGTGIGTAARLLNQFKGKLKIKNIFLYTPFCYRYEIFDAKKKLWLSLSPVNTFHYNFDVSDEVRFMLAQEENMKQYWNINFTAIKYYANQIGAKLYSINNIDFFVNKEGNFPEIARDLEHPGVSYQNLVYEKFLESYENDLPLNENPDDSFLRTSGINPQWPTSFRPFKTIL
jgi:hypothetical protein|tara:strand:+ start:17067 stop:17912 length:846 start_codon:yes stop_codon:yes gene_type:complete